MCEATRRDCKTKKVPNALPGRPAAAPGGFLAFRFACSTTSATPQRTSPPKPSAHPDVPTQTVPKNDAIAVRGVSTATGAASTLSRLAVERTAQTAQHAQTAQTVVCHKPRELQALGAPSIPPQETQDFLKPGRKRPSAEGPRTDPGPHPRLRSECIHASCDRSEYGGMEPVGAKVFGGRNSVLRSESALRGSSRTRASRDRAARRALGAHRKRGQPAPGRLPPG